MIIEKDASSPLTDEDRFHDIVDGRRLVKTLYVRDIAIANRLFSQLTMFDWRERSGRFFFGLDFDLGLEDGTQRMPEISFVSYDRWPARKRLPSDDPWRMTPDLIAEIVTPSCPEDYLNKKMAEYRWAGVKLIWQIFPESERIVVNEGKSKVEILSGADILEGGDVLPGFRMTCLSLFEDGL